MKCTLPKDINHCSLCDMEKMTCNKEEKCCFQEADTQSIHAKYVREERWYEKYYRKK